MYILRQELQTYLDRVYPGSLISAEHTVFGQVHIRFELGGDLNNGTKNRVKQATMRALTLFNETFPDHEANLWILIYEGLDLNGTSNYVFNLFEPEQVNRFYNEEEQVTTRYFIEDNAGNSIPEIANERIVIGRLAVKNIPAEKILNGIANNEMGFKPAISQRIIFFDPITDRAFLMYDDRGCYVWSNEADRIRDLYIKRNDWIVPYHKQEIDAYFIENNIS